MTTIIKSASRPVSPLAIALSALARTYRAATAFTVTVRNRWQLKQLHDLDDHLLADIGLTRADLREAAEMPLLSDPSVRLSLIARGSDPVHDVILPRRRGP